MAIRTLLKTLALTTCLAAFSPEAAQAQFVVPPGTAIIHENWSAVITTPAPNEDGPQLMTYMSPVSDTSQPYFWFMLNVRDNPFSGGGMQIQVWTHNDVLLGSSSAFTAKLNTTNETVTWTKRMRLDTKYGNLYYSIRNGNSTTWGSFSSLTNGPAYVRCDTTLQDLSGYSANTSIKYSRCGWQPNRVSSLTLNSVQYYDVNGTLLATDNTVRNVNLTP